MREKGLPLNIRIVNSLWQMKALSALQLYGNKEGKFQFELEVGLDTETTITITTA